MTFSLFIGGTDVLWNQYSYETNAHITTDSIAQIFQKRKNSSSDKHVTPVLHE